MEINGGIFHFDIVKLSEAMNLTQDEVKAYFTDGRRISFILERRIAREILPEGKLAQSEGASYDVVDKHGGQWEVRSLTQGGIYFCPSYMVGSGRAFNEPGFLSKLNQISGYKVSDITEFPNVPVWIIEQDVVQQWYNKGKLGKNTKISRDTALRLITEAK